MKWRKIAARLGIITILPVAGLAVLASPARAADQGCDTYPFNSTCTTGNVRATTDTHQIWIGGETYCFLLPCGATANVQIRDVNNSKIIWRGSFSDAARERTIGGVYSTYRAEVSCVCASTIHLRNYRSY